MSNPCSARLPVRGAINPILTGSPVVVDVVMKRVAAAIRMTTTATMPNTILFFIELNYQLQLYKLLHSYKG
jgi:hypothetical protein